METSVRCAVNILIGCKSCSIFTFQPRQHGKTLVLLTSATACRKAEQVSSGYPGHGAFLQAVVPRPRATRRSGGSRAISLHCRVNPGGVKRPAGKLPATHTAEVLCQHANRRARALPSFDPRLQLPAGVRQALLTLSAAGGRVLPQLALRNRTRAASTAAARPGTPSEPGAASPAAASRGRAPAALRGLPGGDARPLRTCGSGMDRAAGAEAAGLVAREEGGGCRRAGRSVSSAGQRGVSPRVFCFGDDSRRSSGVLSVGRERAPRRGRAGGELGLRLGDRSGVRFQSFPSVVGREEKRGWCTAAVGARVTPRCPPPRTGQSSGRTAAAPSPPSSFGKLLVPVQERLAAGRRRGRAKNIAAAGPRGRAEGGGGSWCVCMGRAAASAGETSGGGNRTGRGCGQFHRCLSRSAVSDRQVPGARADRPGREDRRFPSRPTAPRGAEQPEGPARQWAHLPGA